VGRSRGRFLIVSLVVALLAIPARGAAGAAGYFVRERGVSLEASWWFIPSPGARTYVDVSVFRGHRKSSIQGIFHGTEVCVRIFKFSRTTESSEKGCTTIPPERLIVVEGLSSARLGATRLSIHRCQGWDPATRDEICDPDRSRRVRISARWVATGPAAEEGERASYDHDGNCESKVVIRGTSRSMEARGRLNGDALGSTDDAMIFDGVDRFWSNCPPL
jgi:hypothetical protein